MAGRKSVLFILLAVGIIALGSGLWLLLGQTPTPQTIRLSLPEGNPIIFEKLEFIMRGQFDYLYIYDDGSVLYIEEAGLRMPTPGHPATRTWKTGKLTPEDLNSLLAYLETSGLDKLTEPYYQFAGKPIEGGPAGSFTTGDMGFNLTVSFDNLSKQVTAYGYLTPDHDETYPDMPSPLNDIYVKLRAIASATTEVAKENIP